MDEQHDDFSTAVPIVEGDAQGKMDAGGFIAPSHSIGPMPVGSSMAVDEAPPSHPTALVFQIVFKVGAIAAYLFCTLFSMSFILTFVIIILLLSMDFWTVKNVTGRLLVGLRWWNEVDAEGKSKWVFESHKAGVKINPFESRVFWISTYITPAIWTVFVFTSLLKLNFQWLLIVVISLSLNMANIVGYLKCESDARKQIEGLAKNYLFSRITGSSG